MRQKQDDELREVINDSQGYVIEAREAAIEELESRASDSDIAKYRDAISHEKNQIQEKKETAKRESRMMLLPKDAPLMMKIIGLTLYGFWLLSIIRLLYNLYTSQVRITGLFFLLLIIGLYALAFLLINSLVRGQNWARIVYTVVVGISLIATLGGIALLRNVNVSAINPIELLWRMIDVGIVVTLFIEPCKYWFGSSSTDNEKLDILDDLE